jgi:signal transduction histidine kinase
MSVLRSWVARLLHAGADRQPDPRGRRRVIVNNAIALTLMVSTLMHVGVLYVAGLPLLGLLLIPMGFAYLVPVALNRAGHLTAARVFLITIPNVLVVTYVFAAGLRGEVTLFFATGCLPVFLCDLRQKRLIGFGIALAFGFAMLVALGGESLMGAHLLSPRAEANLHVALIVANYAVLLLIVLSFVSASARAEHEQRVLQDELAHSQKLESVGRLAAGVAHEINTPIQYVGDSVSFFATALADLRELLASYRELCRAVQQGVAVPADAERVIALEEEADLTYLLEQLPRAVERAGEGIGRVATIVRSMKEFAHPDRAEKAPADINRALLTTVTVAGHAVRGVAEIETELGEIPLLPCHLGALNQVFLNLVVNAADAIEEKIAGTAEKGRIRIKTTQAGDAVLVAISDDGNGIPEQVKPRIFDQFFTTKPVGKGTGQGLAIAHKIVASHAGTIWFESQAGQGTTFFVRLPLAAQAA